MINLILWCCVLCVQINKVVTVQPFYDGDVMVVKGHNVYSSAIGNLMSDGNISIIHIYVANTFYADDDLQLNGIKELQIFTRIWNNTQHVTFDLSGLDGADQKTAIDGLAGKYGNDGTNGGNFFALAKEIINGDFLTVKSNGGNGANGQDGGTSPDIFVLLNVEDDSFPSGWFSNGGDLQDYYKKYFADRGYDSEISGIDEYTSLYAVFVHDKKESFNIRLHPQKCCGTTGMGGVGGIGGQGGTLILKSVGNNNQSESTPKLLANDGLAGESGKDGKTCESLALDVHIAAELKKVVFIFLPLHYSLSSQFTALNHTKSSKCQPVYVSSNETTVPSVSSEPNGTATYISGIVRYKRFLLENMKNASLTDIILETYLAIDENREINDEITLRDLVLEALGLERNYMELKKQMNVRTLYRRLVGRIKLHRDNRSEVRAALHFRKILLQKLIDLQLSSKSEMVLMNLSNTESVTGLMEYRNVLIPMITNITDVDLQNNLDQLRLIANGNYILARYHRAIEQFRLMYFPYAVVYLKDYSLPTSPLAFDDLDHITVATVNNLKTLRANIENIKSDGKVWGLNNIDGTDPRDAFYVWKNADFRAQIQNLFEGKKVKLLADAKQAKEQFNAIKFNTIDLVFRSTVQTVNNQLTDVLKSFNVVFKHPGQSLIRCNHNFYELISDPMSMTVSFEKDKHFVPMTRTGSYGMLQYNDPILSPYTLWEIQLVEDDTPTRNIIDLVQFRDLDIDVELHGTGKFIEENAPICEKKKLSKFYTQVVN